MKKKSQRASRGTKSRRTRQGTRISRRGASGKEAKRSKGKVPPREKEKKNLFLPLFTLWLVVMVVLASLLYWGHRGNGRPAPPSNRPTVRSGPVEATAPKEAPSKRPAAKSRHGRITGDHTASVPRPHGSPHPPKPLASLRSPGKPPAPGIERPAPVPPVKPSLASVAIVIDDFGNDVEAARKFLALPLNLTFSVMPMRSHSREIAQMAVSRGHEVIIHMPMEPQGYPKVNPGPCALLTTMGARAIRETLDKALEENPLASGLNNHMGSAFTCNAEKMRIVLKELQKRNLYFLDSFTTSESVGLQTAQHMGVACIRRDVFLDHVQSEDFVAHQVEELIRLAKKRGHAVAIGHPHDVTLRGLFHAAQRLKEEGIRVVPLGELVRGAKRNWGLERGKSRRGGSM